MLRIASAAYALCAALLLSIGLFGSTPAEAGDYYGQRYGYHSNYRPYRSAYYGRPAYQSAYYGRPYRPYYRPSYSSYRPYYRPYYSSYYSDGYDTGYYNTGYRYAGYYDNGYSSYGCTRRTVYIPYGWSWYKSHDYRC